MKYYTPFAFTGPVETLIYSDIVGDIAQAIREENPDQAAVLITIKGGIRGVAYLACRKMANTMSEYLMKNEKKKALSREEAS